ncbi:putative DNA-3-methyladenine glycosylase I [Medicago truncatula]|uniref:Putative DNA-3-methyladenine glycosylase I n=1 Tax=Medicago truncatula TaxID=3880 RepID=A0A396GM12_MEDTR|nr:putative DNA-3-methyladenine glycosylase I [Medicago truncatula]
MSKTNVRKQALERSTSFKDTQKILNQNFFHNKIFKKVYPIGLQKSTSSLSLSSVSLSLSQNSNDSSQADSLTPLDERISSALRLISASSHERRETAVAKTIHQQSPLVTTEPGELRRCNWITKNSDKLYVEFHDECWGVPAYDDNKLFEMLAMSGLLMDYNWTEIIKRREPLREVFAGFDPYTVAKMEEQEIIEITSNKALSLADSRVMCIVDNAKCIMKESRVVRECGSFSSYIWSFVNHKPIINKYKYPRNVPLRSPKAEALSKDMVKRGFRFVGPVIVHSFMQAAGLTIDHLVDCYRHSECVSLAERPWRHI